MNDEDGNDEDGNDLEGKIAQYAAAGGDLSGCPQDLVRFNLFGAALRNAPAGQALGCIATCKLFLVLLYIKGAKSGKSVGYEKLGWPYMQGRGWAKVHINLI